MDVRKWLNAAIENSTYDGYVNQLALRNELEPKITKLVETLRGISEATVMESYDTGKVISAGYKEAAQAALAELEKP